MSILLTFYCVLLNLSILLTFLLCFLEYNRVSFRDPSEMLSSYLAFYSNVAYPTADLGCHLTHKHRDKTIE